MHRCVNFFWQHKAYYFGLYKSCFSKLRFSRSVWWPLGSWKNKGLMPQRKSLKQILEIQYCFRTRPSVCTWPGHAVFTDHLAHHLDKLSSKIVYLLVKKGEGAILEFLKMLFLCTHTHTHTHTQLLSPLADGRINNVLLQNLNDVQRGAASVHRHHSQNIHTMSFAAADLIIHWTLEVWVV